MDTIANFLTRIRNAGMARHDKVDIPNSKIKEGIAKILKEKGYIKTFRVAQDGKQGVMRVYLKYTSSGKPVIENIERMSKPGLRTYIKSNDIPSVRSGFGLAILSTSRGVISGDEASSLNVGGEYIARVW